MSQKHVEYMRKTHKMKDILKQITQVLMDHGGQMTAEAVADQLGCTDRYVRKTVAEAGDTEKEFGFSIQYVFRKGYCLVISDPSLFEKCMNSEEEKQRAKDALADIIESPSYIKIDTLADCYFTSRTTMERILSEAREIAETYHITISYRQKYGIIASGTEINKRICLSYCRKGEKEREHTIEAVQEILFNILKKNDYLLSDIGFNNLSAHIFIMIQRIKKGKIVTETVQFEEGRFLAERKIADDLVAELEKTYCIQIPASEESYIMLHLLAKQIVKDESAIRPEVYELIDQIFEEIKRQRNIDLFENKELRAHLAMHLQPLLFRLKYHTYQDNPLVEKVKQQMPLGYDLAVISKDMIEKKYGLRMDDSETAFLATHFALAVSGMNQTAMHGKFLVICSTGKGTARLMQYKLMNEYGFKEEDITLSSLIQMREMDVSTYTCVFTTVNIPYEVSIPVILVDPMMNEASAKKIAQFFQQQEITEVKKNSLYADDRILADLQFNNIEEVFHFIAEKTKEYIKTDTDVYEQLMKREELSSTEIGNECCMPHPLNWFPEEPFSLIIILKKPMQWKNDKVKFIFFTALPKTFENRLQVTDQLIMLVSDREKLNAFASHPNVNTLYQTMEVQK